MSTMDETRAETRRLVRQAVEMNLLGPDALLDPAGPSAPEGYELIQEIGRGGAGTVYLARDESLDRLAAIKFLTDAGPADVERFRREARLTARLHDASIVQVYELGEADGWPYIAMQYLDGGNLAGAALELPEVVRLMRDVAAALHHAHCEGIVHRDIKPENILLDRAGRAYVADFGIARDLYGSAGRTISREGQVIGTPGLMPPEQARGEIQAVDARSDVYALGATLYRKLTGRYPFEGRSLVDVLHAVIHDDPPMPRTFSAAIPRRLEAIIVKSMHKAREHRHQSMAELGRDLDSFLAGESVAAESSAWFRRLVVARGGTPPPAPAEPHSDTFWTRGMEIVRDLAAWDADLYRVTGSLARSFTRLDLIRARLDELLAARPDTAWARFYRGVVLFRRGNLEAALEEMERSIDRVRDLAGAYFELGRLYLALYLKEHHRARKHITRTGIVEDLRTARRRLEQAAVALQEARRLRGELAPWHAGYARAVARFAESDFAACTVVCDELLEREPDREEVWKLRADALRFAGGDAIESYDRALDVRRSYFEALYAKAEAHLDHGRAGDARAALERACAIHPEYVDALSLLAQMDLAEARSGGDGAVLRRGRDCAQRARAIDPDHYDATVTLGEIELESARAGQGEAALDGLAAALHTLETARTLSGCENRVNTLIANVLLERVRLSRTHGRDAGPDLDEARRLCGLNSARTEDNDPWIAIAAEIERLERA